MCSCVKRVFIIFQLKVPSVMYCEVGERRGDEREGSSHNISSAEASGKVIAEKQHDGSGQPYRKSQCLGTGRLTSPQFLRRDSVAGRRLYHGILDITW